jgi:hypothetical protein
MKPTEVHLRLVSNRRRATAAHESSAHFFDEFDFNEILSLEKKRSQRSMKPLILMCLDISGMMVPNFTHEHRGLLKTLAACIRETDILGWYKRESIMGILFTEIESASSFVLECLFRRVVAHLVSVAGSSVLFKVNVTFHIYPESKEQEYTVDYHDSKRPAVHANKTDGYRLTEKIQGMVHEARKRKNFTALLIETLDEPVPDPL